jgi:hypothetical protein
VDEIEETLGLSDTALAMIVVAAIRVILPRVRVGKNSRVSMQPQALVLELDSLISWGQTDAFITDGSDTVVALCEFKSTNVVFVHLFRNLLAMKSRISPSDARFVPMTACGLLCMRDFFVVCDIIPSHADFSKTTPHTRCLRRSEMIGYDELPQVLAALAQTQHAPVFCSRSKPPRTSVLCSPQPQKRRRTVGCLSARDEGLGLEGGGSGEKEAGRGLMETDRICLDGEELRASGCIPRDCSQPHGVSSTGGAAEVRRGGGDAL